MMSSPFVRLEPGVVAEILRICEVMLDELRESKTLADGLYDARGFGDFESAKQLAAGYSRKGAGTPQSASERMQQFIDALTHLRDAFATGGEAFLDTESDWARKLAITDPDNGTGNGHQGAQ
ncbi:hypothetical protein [Rhodococcus pyridinivorans]|uniref:hypothetical protein n=1 Tax=Rhodococcus pyridinivorans TaxID=103816 RepID=UPI00352BD870